MFEKMKIQHKKHALERQIAKNTKRVQHDGSDLIFIPQTERGYKICYEAVVQNGNALEFVPHEFHTRDLVVAAIKSRPFAIAYLKPEFQNETYYSFAVEQEPVTISLVPEDRRTLKMYRKAYADEFARRYVPATIAELVKTK